MTPLRVFFSRLLALFTKHRRDADLNDEIQTHLHLLAAEHVGRGLSPADAHAAARREFGGVEQIKELHLLLAAIGIYGLTAYSVTRRTREIGIRMALGAQRADVVTMILRQGMSLAVLGSAIGLILAAAAGRLLTVFLLGVSPIDPVTFFAAAALFVAVSLAACFVPARRAARTDPTVALRYE